MRGLSPIRLKAFSVSMLLLGTSRCVDHGCCCFSFDVCLSSVVQSPYAPGSAYVLLHHVFGEINGKKGVWGHAIGGMVHDTFCCVYC